MLYAECSFQGGDGFLHFQTAALAEATMRAVFAWSQHAHDARQDDRFYSDINFSWDVYRTIKGWQETLFRIKIISRRFRPSRRAFSP